MIIPLDYRCQPLIVRKAKILHSFSDRGGWNHRGGGALSAAVDHRV